MSAFRFFPSRMARAVRRSACVRLRATRSVSATFPSEVGWLSWATAPELPDELDARRGREPARHGPARIARIGSVLLLTESKPQPGRSAVLACRWSKRADRRQRRGRCCRLWYPACLIPEKLKARVRLLTAAFFPGSSNRVRVRRTADFLERRPGTAVALL